jgi:hypothetical protein
MDNGTAILLIDAINRLAAAQEKSNDLSIKATALVEKQTEILEKHVEFLLRQEEISYCPTFDCMADLEEGLEIKSDGITPYTEEISD